MCIRDSDDTDNGDDVGHYCDCDDAYVDDVGEDGGVDDDY